jgi:excisionase family DNA binding protein
MTMSGNRVDGDFEYDELLTVAELASLLRVPAATLRYWRHIGSGPRGFRIGRHVRYYREDVDVWLQERRASTGSRRVPL